MNYLIFNKSFEMLPRYKLLHNSLINENHAICSSDTLSGSPLTYILIF